MNPFRRNTLFLLGILLSAIVVVSYGAMAAANIVPPIGMVDTYLPTMTPNPPTPTPPSPDIPPECAGMTFNQIIYLDSSAEYFGSATSELIFGTSGNDIIHGGNGKDCLVGLDGNDTLYGDNANDVLIGGNGDDQLFGDRGGKDSCYGGPGNNTFTDCDDSIY